MTDDSPSPDDCVATRRAVSDVLAHGLRGDLAHSAVGVELGQLLQSALTADVGDGAAPGGLLEALRDACHQDAVAYARLLELIVLAGLDELQLLADLPSTEVTPIRPDLPPPPPRRTSRRRR